MRQDELDALIDLHEAWLSTSGASGLRLKLQDVFLAGVSFLRRNLSQSSITNTNLTFSDFSDSVFISADLNHSLLSSSDLSNADFSSANLSYSMCIQSNCTNTIFTDADRTGATGYPA